MIRRGRYKLTPTKSEYSYAVILCSRLRTSIPSLLKSYAAQVTRLKPSFSRRKPSEKKKLRYSSEHPDADNSNKSSHRDAVANHANPVSSSNAILHMPVNQVWLRSCKKEKVCLSP